MDKILLPAIDKVDLNSEEGKKRVLEYLYGRKSIEYFSDRKKLQINDNLVYTVEDCRKSTIGYHTSYTNEIIFKEVIKACDDFLNLVKNLENLLAKNSNASSTEKYLSNDSFALQTPSL